MTRTAKPTRRYTQTARAQSAEETGQRIVDAFLELTRVEWYDLITLDRVAADAGVSVQTIVRRFGGKDGLLAESLPTLSAQVAARRATPAGDDAAFVRNLVQDYEHHGDSVIRLLALETRHEAVGRMVEHGRRHHRTWVGEQFEDALAGMPERERSDALDALVVTTDVYAWKLLRRDRGHTVEDTARIMLGMTRAITGRDDPDRDGVAEGTRVRREGPGGRAKNGAKRS